jgi:hypothetical protein
MPDKFLKVEIRKHQHVDVDGNNQIVQCTEGVAEYVSGTLTDYDWYDITEDVVGIENMVFSASISETTNKISDKASTTQITLINDAYNRVYEWILSSDCSFLNYFDVKISDVEYNYEYKLFELKPDNIDLCDEDGCQMTLPLREVDALKSIVDKTIIHDNWQGWFGGGAKDFPCIQVFKYFVSPQSGVFLAAWAIINALNFFTFGLIGALLDYDNIKRKAYGFGYFLPLVPIRAILENAMAKVNYSIETPFDSGKELEHDCHLVSEGAFYKDFEKEEPTSPSQKFIFENRSLQTIGSFLDDICLIYNMKWQIVNEKLIIKFIKDIDNSEPVVEVSQENTYSNCRNFLFNKAKGGGLYQYQKDPTDQASTTTINAYNDAVDFDGKTNNALLSGFFEKNFNFSSNSFWGDRFGSDVSQEIEGFAKIMTISFAVMLLTVSFSFLGGAPEATIASPGFLTSYGIALGAAALLTGGAIASINELKSNSQYGDGNKHFRGSLKLFGDGSINKHRIIRIDPNSADNNKKPVSIDVNSIIKNPYYNLDNVDWKNQFNNVYDTLESAFNYQLYFDAKYKGNLYEYHETTDNLFFLSQTNELRTIQTILCSDTLQAIGLNDDNNNILGKLITFKGEKFKVLKYDISYQNFSIKLQIKRVL